MSSETMTIVGKQEGEVTVGVLRPSARVTVDVDSFGGLTFEEPKHVDIFIGWLQEAKQLAETLRLQPEGEPS
jgi:hypothetical protein